MSLFEGKDVFERMSGNPLFSDSTAPTQATMGVFTQAIIVLPAGQGGGRLFQNEALVSGEGR